MHIINYGKKIKTVMLNNCTDINKANVLYSNTET